MSSDSATETVQDAAKYVFLDGELVETNITLSFAQISAESKSSHLVEVFVLPSWIMPTETYFYETCCLSDRFAYFSWKLSDPANGSGFSFWLYLFLRWLLSAFLAFPPSGLLRPFLQYSLAPLVLVALSPGALEVGYPPPIATHH